MTQGAVDKSSAKKADSTSTQYVYFFGGGKADGNGKMKDVLGGKGCRSGGDDERRIAGASGLHDSDRIVPRVHARQAERRGGREMYAALTKLEELQGQKLGAGKNPLLVSVRSGASSPCPA